MNALDPNLVTSRIRQAGRYSRSRKVLEKLVVASPKLWIPALIEAANRDGAEARPIVEQLLKHYAAACQDFQSRHWLYRETLRTSGHFHGIQVELATWIIQQRYLRFSGFRPLIAEMHLNLSQHLQDGGRISEALHHSFAAVNRYKTLAKSDPKHIADLAWALQMRVQQLSALGRRREAAEANKAALRFIKQLDGDESDLLMIRTCVSMGENFLAEKKCEDALDSLQIAYALISRSKQLGPEFAGLAAQAGSYLAISLANLHRAHEAQPFAEEALRRMEPLAARDPGTYLLNYLKVIHVVSQLAIVLRQPERGLALQYEAVRMLEKESDREPGVFLTHLLTQLKSLCMILILAGKLSEAEHYVRKSIRLAVKWGRMAKSSPAIHLGASYAQLAMIHVGTYQVEAGLQAALRARLYLRRLPEGHDDRRGFLPRVERQVDVLGRFKKSGIPIYRTNPGING